LSERDEVLQKLWTSQSAVQQLQTLNQQILGDMDQLRPSMKMPMKRQTSPLRTSERGRHHSPKKQSKSSRSRSKKQGLKEGSAALLSLNNPLLTQLDQLKSTYTSKLASIRTGLDDRQSYEKQSRDQDALQFKNEALNMAQLAAGDSDYPGPRERPQVNHLTFAEEGDGHEQRD